MTSPARQHIKSREKSFFLAFIPAFLLTVAALYFIVTATLLPLTALWAEGVSIYCFEAAADSEWCRGRDNYTNPTMIETLPEIIYGDPPRILSLRPLAVMGALISMVIFWSARRKTRRLRNDGGAYIAGLLGGKLLGDPKQDWELELSRLVGQAAASAGLPRPPIYILPSEETVNCAVVGRSGRDAVIMFTDGARIHLTGQELKALAVQGFARLLNGDAALVLTMSGWLQAPLYLTVGCDSFMKRMDRVMNLTMGKGIEVYIVAGLLKGLNAVGYLCAMILEMLFTRDRVMAADSEAVRLVHDRQGLIGALKKIGGTPKYFVLEKKSYLILNSFFFAAPYPGRNGGFLSAHPSVQARLKALDPAYDGSVTPVILE